MVFKAEVEDIVTIKENGSHRITGISLKNGDSYEANLVMIAPGRDGSAWLTEVLKKLYL